MTKARHKRPPPKPPPGHKERRRILLVAGVCALMLTVLGLGWSLAWWYAAPAPPLASFAEADPAVVEAIEAARRSVWWNPHSVAAWTRLGELLRAHGYEPESNFCFAQ